MDGGSSSFVKNAVILSTAGLLVRVLGAVYRIPLYRLIEEEGMGLYQMGYNVYVALLAISITGIPIAISKLVAEETSQKRYAEAQRVFKVAALLLSGIGLCSSIILILSARYIATNLIAEPRAVYPLIAVAPAIFLVSMMASLRGYFQGLQMMGPSAISQVLEQVGRVVVVLALAFLLTSRGAPVEHTAAAASFGAVAGSFVGFAVIAGIYAWQRPKIAQRVRNFPQLSVRSTSVLIKRILVFAVPITIGAMVIPLISAIDTALVPRRLQVAGFTPAAATGLYGQLTGGAMPLINLPAMLAYALAASLVPSISQAQALRQTLVVRMRSAFAIKLILLLSLPAAVGLHVLATPIATMLYDSPAAGIPLSVLAFAAIFLTLHQTTSGILQGLGYTIIPVRNLAIGGGFKIFLNYTLTAIPALNIRGAAIASVISFMISSCLNVLAVKRYTGIRINVVEMFIKPIVAVVLMGWGTALAYNHLILREIGTAIVTPNTVATLGSVVVGSLVYGVMVMLLRILSERELRLIPIVGPTLSPILSKLHLVRRD